MIEAVRPVVALRGVNHHLGEGALRKQILFDITADVLPGEIVMVMGPSGSGKTTLLNLIGAARTVTDGSVQVLGSELRGASPAEITRMRRRLGFVFQHHHLLDALTACENVQMGLGGAGLSRSETVKRSLEMLDRVELRDYAHSYPKKLSGGQCQRVAIARALVRDSELVLADEPTAALDKQTGRNVVELLRRLARERGCTVVMVTHDPRILDVADRLMYLEDGRISSFASTTAAHAIHLLTVLRPMLEAGELAWFLGGMSRADFVDLMRTVAAEAAQFLNVFEFGSQQEIKQAFHALMQEALERMRVQLDASIMRLWVMNDTKEMRCVAGAISESAISGDAQCPQHALAALSAREVRYESGIFCIPLPNREGAPHAVLAIEGVASAPIVERALRDFTRPFGLLAQIAATGNAMAAQ